MDLQADILHVLKKNSTSRKKTLGVCILSNGIKKEVK